MTGMEVYRLALSPHIFRVHILGFESCLQSAYSTWSQAELPVVSDWVCATGLKRG